VLCLNEREERKGEKEKLGRRWLKEAQTRRRSRRGEESRRRREDWCANTRVDEAGVQVGMRREKCGVNEEEEEKEGKSEGEEGYIYSLPIACQVGAAKMFAPEIFPDG